MNCFIVLLFCTLMVLPKTRCGEVQSRIVGGHLLQPDDRQRFSFLVSLQYHKPNPVTESSGYPHVCQGTLVNAQFIVTAAHCFSDKTFQGLENLEDWTAVAGEYDLGGTEGVEQTRLISEIFPHPDFDMILVNLLNMSGYMPNWDVALLKVARPFELNDYVSTLSYDPACVQEGIDSCAISGWGMREDGTYARYPYEFTMLMPDLRYCHEKYDSISPIVAQGPKFCANGPNLGDEETLVGDACLADSGGPFVCECSSQGPGTILTGIVSFGVECGNPKYPGVYTNLKERRIFDFIWDTIMANLS